MFLGPVVAAQQVLDPSPQSNPRKEKKGGGAHPLQPSVRSLPQILGISLPHQGVSGLGHCHGTQTGIFHLTFIFLIIKFYLNSKKNKHICQSQL